MNTTTVPWNASWSAELDYEIRPCRWAGGQLALWQPHRPGQGVPIFAKPHNVRQRQSIIKMLCTVCGRPTLASDRWWFGLGHFREGYFMTTESPVHHACAELAQTVCPHLRKLKPDLEPFPRGAVVLSSIIGGSATDRDFGVRIGGRKVIGHLKLAWPESAVAFKTNEVTA